MDPKSPASSAYQPRVVDSELDALLAGLPAVSIEGPKAVGKTKTAIRRVVSTFAFDRPAVKEVAEADFGQLLRAPRPILFDEWQQYPPSWDFIRRAVDDEGSPGQYVLTGSTGPTSAPTHSGAGRIIRLRMRPMSLFERQLEEPTVSFAALLTGDCPEIEGRSSVDLDGYVDEIFCSGFPGIRTLTDRALRAQLRGYVDRIIDRDFEESGYVVRNAGALRRWLTAYAAASSTSAAFERIRDAATSGEGDKPAKVTASAYRSILESMWILDPVPAWLPTKNHLQQLGHASRHQLADPALAVTLLGLDKPALLGLNPSPHEDPRDGTFLGAMFESLVTLSIRVLAQGAEARVSHLRTHRGEREIDLIVEGAGGRVLALEVKLASTVNDHDVRHLRWLRDRIGDDLADAAVITTGQHAYRRTDGIAVIPAALIGP